MKFHLFMLYGILVLALLSVAVNGIQEHKIKELRKDVSRVSKVQVQCAGEIDYGPCIEERLQEWANDSR